MGHLQRSHIRVQRWPQCLGRENLLDGVGDVLLPTSMDARFVDGCGVDVIRRGACDDGAPRWQLHTESNQPVSTLVRDCNTAFSF